MKFSVLLPTRNRLELLKYAVETVRRQDDEGWEIVVSDNASEQDVAGYVRALGDPRVRYVRTDRSLPVTDNWNRALEHSTGDYLLMLGDDDGLLKGCLRRARALVEQYREPDCIYTNALLYAYPGVMPGLPNGFLQPYGYAPFFRGALPSFLLEPRAARRLARAAMNFEMRYTFNMQHAIVSRRFVESLRGAGPFYQSPYPDFYATNVLMLKARSIVVSAVPLVVVGISPKSFGYYYFNDQEKKGVEFLDNLPDAQAVRRLSHVILPGLADKTAWLVAMETIRANYGAELRLRVGYNRYRYLQVLHVYGRYRMALRCRDPRLAGALEEFDALRGKLALWERLLYLAPLRAASAAGRLVPGRIRERLTALFLVWTGKTPQLELRETEPRHENILDVFERVNPDPGTAP